MKNEVEEEKERNDRVEMKVEREIKVIGKKIILREDIEIVEGKESLRDIGDEVDNKNRRKRKMRVEG